MEEASVWGLLFPFYSRLQLTNLLAQLFDLLAHLRQAVDVRVNAFVFVQRPHGNAPPHAGPDNLAGQDSCLRADDGALLDSRVIAKPDLAADAGVVFNHRAA